ncbi:MAG: ABC transporter ATP-binding protein [Candidatus Saccharimonadales bacterium]
MLVIKLDNLTKTFGTTTALRNFSLEIESGQVVGLLGPNGAGKSTLIKSLAGGVRPSAGGVEVFGQNPLRQRRQLAHRFGYMPQAACLYEDLSVRDNIRFFARLHSAQVSTAAIDELLEFLGMSEKRDERVQHLSGGMKTRVSLACAMIHQPNILFLDEPTAGLDLSLKRILWSLFKRLAGEGKTLLISTHLMDEALLCDRLAIIREGQLLVHDTPAQIIARGQVKIELEQPDGKQISQSVAADPVAIADFLHDYGLDPKVKRLSVERESLEDITIAIVDGEQE